MQWPKRILRHGAARHSFAALLAAAALLSPAWAQPEQIDLSSQPVHWNPESRGDIAAGELEWAGEIELKSTHKRFGGWSGLAISADGSTLLAVSDEAMWLTGQLLYDEKGRLSGMGDAKIAPLLGPDGKPFAGKSQADAEGLTVDGPDPLKSNAYVSFERQHRVLRYDLGKNGFDAKPEKILTERQLGKLNANAGLESLTTLKPKPGVNETRLLLVSENSRDARGNVRAFIAEGRKVKRLSFRLHDPYHPTDIARLPNGDFLLLERRFSLLAGAGMQLRLIREDAVRPGAVADGNVLLDTGQRRSIDNMEGLAVRQDEKGNVWVYAISDDNFNPLQRTLLVMFRLKPETLTPLQTQGKDGSLGAKAVSAPAESKPK
ncbi:esterase-like activity of phytase family protein [Parvibaculum sp.]|uniref:esterase-like activity of phytase family protein n=1 Tax=Parvibaculum sp. TaxID=2024848 RepID=UPI00320E5A0B